MRRYEVISADGHLETPGKEWLARVPKSFAAYLPRLVSLADGGEAWLIEGMSLIHNGTNLSGGSLVKLKGASYWRDDGAPMPGAGGAKQRLQEQDLDGVDAEVLYPPAYISRFIEKVSSRPAYLAMVRAYNEHVASDFCAIAPDRLIGVGLVPTGGLVDALSELEHIRKLGMRAACISQFPNGGPIAKPEDDEFWRLALDLKVPLTAHVSIGNPTHPLLVGAARGEFDLVGVMMRGTMPAAVNFLCQTIASGVFDRLPCLQLYIAESNAGWLPEVLYMMDDSYRTFRDVLGAKLERLPSQYVREHFFFGIVRDPLALRLREWLPAERLMWSSDFPHVVTSFPRSRDHIADIFAGVPEPLKRQILVGNPCQFFGLDPHAPITPTPS